jgi:hypothetical protein
MRSLLSSPAGQSLGQNQNSGIQSRDENQSGNILGLMMGGMVNVSHQIGMGSSLGPDFKKLGLRSLSKDSDHNLHGRDTDELALENGTAGMGQAGADLDGDDGEEVADTSPLLANGGNGRPVTVIHSHSKGTGKSSYSANELVEIGMGIESNSFSRGHSGKRV